MIVIKEEGKKPIRAWVGEQVIPGASAEDVLLTGLGTRPDIEESALKQLRNLAGLPFIHPHGVAAMADVHMGTGTSVGAVIATEKAIIPAAVGVDIGCGMIAAKLCGATANDVDEKLLRQIHSEILHTVPTGFAKHEPGTQNRKEADKLWARGKSIFEKHERIAKGRKDDPFSIMQSQFGSLGGGNHFIEVCLDNEQGLWVMLHSGSRGIGNEIGRYFIELARQDMKKHFINLPDQDLAYLVEGTEHFDEYVNAVGWAQDYARANRAEMLRRIMIVLRRHVEFGQPLVAANCHHNYVERENHFGRNVWLTRKGAIRARDGDYGIIPGSMGTRSYIVRGKGNADSYHSCSHGAGRRMGRKQAERELSVESLNEAMKGVVWMEDAAVLDEHPGAYKDIDQVMAQQTDLVEVVYTLKQILNVKGK